MGIRLFSRITVIGMGLGTFVSAALPASSRAGVTATESTSSTMHVSYWAGEMALCTGNVWRRGRLETRSRIELDDARESHDQPGAPAVPYLTCRVLLPPSTTLRAISVRQAGDGRRLTPERPLAFVDRPWTGYDMTDPAQARAWADANAEDAAIYAADSLFPASQARFTERDFRGYSVAEIDVTPFQYNPVRNELTFSRHLELELHLKPQDAVAWPVRDNPADREIVSRMVVNPEAIQNYNALDGKRVKPAGGPAGATNAYYAIITTASFTSDFDPLRAFHSYDADHQAVVVTLDQIYTRYPDTNTPSFLRIAGYIRDVLYANGTEYVLIGGDTELVPSYAGYSDFAYSSGHIPVGRFSVESAQDISNCIAKAVAPVADGTDRVQLIPRPDEVGPSVCAFTNLFLPYLPTDVDGSLYNGQPTALFPAMDTHTILWARGHGHYLYPQWAPSWFTPNNTHIRPVGVNFGCQGAVFENNAPYEHPAELYQCARNGNAAYIGTVADVWFNSFDQEFFESYFLDGAVEPRVGDMMMLAYPRNDLYTLLGDPRYEIVSRQFKALPRITLPGGSSHSRSYNIDTGTGQIEDVVFRVVSFNGCAWAVTNLACLASISNRLSFSCSAGTNTTDVRLRFLGVTNIAAGTYSITFDVRDTTHDYPRQKETVSLMVTDKNILTDDDFFRDGSRLMLPAGDYVLAGDLVVPNGAILALSPGTRLHTDWDFGSGWKVVADAGGRIEALGTATNPIAFCDAFGGNGVPFEFHGSTLPADSGTFRYCLFNSVIAATNEPIVHFVNCTFCLPSVPLFPARIKGSMTNCLISARNMGTHGPAGDLSGFSIGYCCLAPTATNGFATPCRPEFHVHGREILWGNDFLEMPAFVPGLLSVCLNAGDPQGPPDPDGTRADIGAYYHDLSGSIRVPANYPTIQAAVNAASTSKVAVIVGSGSYSETLRIPSAFSGIRIIGESETNRPLLYATNHPGNLVSFDGSAFLENLVLRHVGKDATGRTVSVSASGWINAGFRNCAFTGNRDNTDVFYAGYTNGFGGLCVYLSGVDFTDNSANGSVLRIDEGLRNSTMEPWSWIRECAFSSNVASGAILQYRPADRYFFARELTAAGNQAPFLLLNSANGLSSNAVLDIRNALFHHNAGAIRAENHGNTTFENATFHSNLISVVADGNARLELRSSVFWDNAASLVPSNGGAIAVNYTDINSPWTGIGSGNIATNPLFVSASGCDYHLQRTSPCIDVGDPVSDYANEPEPNGSRINMGRYGNTTEAAVWELGIRAGIRLAGSRAILDFSSRTGQWYRLEFTESLLRPWTNIMEVMSTGETVEIECPVRGNVGFYRIFNYSP